MTDSTNWLHLNRIVRFGETDAAGVMHFYKLLGWCHESWEASLQKLDNGNYFITTIGKDDGAHSLEVTSAGEIVWQVKYNVGTPNGIYIEL